jgi:hypothetical protein
LIAHSEIHVIDETIHAGNGKSICLGGKLRGAYFFKVRLHCIFCVRRIPQESEGTTIERR